MTEPPDRSEARSEARIEAALARLGAEHEPPPGWEARVLAATSARQARPWWMYAAPAVALVAAAAIAIVVVWPRPARTALALQVRVESKQIRRGTPADQATGRIVEAVLDDVVHVAVSAGTGARAIRVYRDDGPLVLSCPGDPVCHVSGDGIAVAFTPPAIGDYVILALATSASLPPLPGSYSADIAALNQAGVLDIRQTTVQVR